MRFARTLAARLHDLAFPVSRTEPPHIRRRKPLFETLEPRLLLSANLIGIPAWVPEGPGPNVNAQDENVPAETTLAGNPPNPVSGAIEALAIDPGNPNIVFIGAASGGVWKTTTATYSRSDGVDNNGNGTVDEAGEVPSWAALTDQFASLQIAALQFDPTDATNQTLVAGIGGTSNAAGFSIGRFGGQTVGALTGLLRTSDGGTTWTELGNAAVGSGGLQGLSVSALGVRGNTMLVTTESGLFLSTNGGTSFQNISGTNGLAAGPAYDLAADPSNTSRFYAAVGGANGGVFRTDNLGGNWTDVSDAAIGALINNSTDNIRLAVSATAPQPIYLAIANNGQLAGVLRSADAATAAGAATWVAMDLPQTLDAPRTITGASNAAAIVITTSANHGYANGDRVRIGGVTGNTAANGDWTVTVIDATHFSLDGSVGNGNSPGGGTANNLQGILHGRQAFPNLGLYADPGNANLVYIDGDRQDFRGGDSSIGANNFTGRIFRGDASVAAGGPGAVPSPQWTPLTHTGTSNASAPHADARAMAFDSNNTLIYTSDGGIFRETSPRTTGGRWLSMNGDLQVTQFYDISYDSVFNVIMGGAQDTGTPLQTSTGAFAYTDQTQGDGPGTLIDNFTLAGTPRSIRYLGLTRRTFSDAITRVGADVVVFPAAGLAGLVSVGPIALNALAPPAGQSTRLVIAGTAPMVATGTVYESTNAGTAANTAAVTWTQVPTGAGFASGNAIAAGGRRLGVDKPEVLYVASGNQIFLRTAAGGTLTATAGQPAGAGTITDIALDPNDWMTAFVTDGTQVYSTTDAGKNWTNVTGDLTNSTFRLGVRLAVIPGAGADAVLFSGTSGVMRMLTNAQGVWSEFGRGLPNAAIGDMQYDATDDVLVVGTFGRGAWEVPSTSTSVFSTGILRIDGDTDFAGENDTIRLLRDTSNPLLLDVLLNGALSQFQFSVIQQIDVNGLGGNDTLIVDDGSGLINVVNGTRYDGGTGTDALLFNATFGDDSITLNDTQIDAGSGLLTYSSIETLTVDAKAGNDTVDGHTLTRDVTILGGPGNDTLSSGSGSDVLNGGEGDDHMAGGDGGDRYVFAGLGLGVDSIFELEADTGVDVLDFSLFGAAISIDLRLTSPQVVSPGNLTLTLQECNAIEDVIGSPFGNTLHGNDAPNHLVGSAGNDELHGEGGDDWLEGLAGDDVLFGEDGNDLLDGGTGADLLVGDHGKVQKITDASGATRTEVLLIDQVVQTGNRVVNDKNPMDASLLGQDLAILAGVQDSKGNWETRLLTFTLQPHGDDTLVGGDDDDLLFGQRGHDVMQGGDGNDYLEGNEGDDHLQGDAGNDVLIGDNSYNFVATAEALPRVAHGYEIVTGEPRPCGVVPDLGPVLLPGTALMPSGVQAITPFGAALYEGARNLAVTAGLPVLRDASGRVVQAFASLIPAVENHLVLVAGNDELLGGAGDDRLIGDNNAVIAPFQSGVAGMLTDFEHAMAQLAVVERILPPHPVTVPAVASDLLEGDEGDDVLVGDNNLMLIGTASTTGPLQGGLAQAAHDFDAAVSGFAGKVKGKPGPVGFTTSRDFLQGGDGNDRLVGDHVVTVALAIDGPAGSSVKTDWLQKVRLPSLVVGGDQDLLLGGGGDDALVGDSHVAVVAGVGTSPFAPIADTSLVPGADALLAIPEDARSGTAIVADPLSALGARGLPFLPAVQAGAGTGSGFHTVTLGRVLDSLIVNGAQDTLDGGDGEDLLIGDGSIQIAAYVQGPFATLSPGTMHPDRQLVVVNTLVGDMQLNGSQDELAGGADNDLLIGDFSAVAAGVVAGPVLTVGAGQANNKLSQQRNDDLVQFVGLIGNLRAEGDFDVLRGDTGDDALIGDHYVLVAGVIAGPVIQGSAAATGFTSDKRFQAAVELTELVTSVNLVGAGDALFGGDGDDTLIGDSNTLIAGIQRGAVLAGPAALVAQAAFEHPYSEAIVDFDGLVGKLASIGSPDELHGESGADALVGDDQLTVLGVVEGDLLVAGPGAPALPAKKTQDAALVEFDRLLGSADLQGTMDALFGDEGGDLAIGDDAVLIAGVDAGAIVRADGALALAIAAAQGRLSAEGQVDFDRLVDSVVLHGDADTIDGGADDDRLIGDHHVAVVGAVAGPLLVARTPVGSGSGAITAPGSDWLVNFTPLVNSIELIGAADSLTGAGADDCLLGDSRVVITGAVEGALVSGFAPGASKAADLVRFDSLVASIKATGANDRLDGGAGSDELVGDNALEAFGHVSGGAAASALLPAIRYAKLFGSASLSGGTDTLLGGEDSDELVGDNAAALIGVRLCDFAGALAVAIDQLADNVTLAAGRDTLDGGAGDDRLLGDNRIEAAAVEGALPAGAALALDVHTLVSGSLTAKGADDQLLGSAGNDFLIGDNQATVVAHVATGTLDGALSLEVDGVIGTLLLEAGKDTLDGGDGTDILVGDQHTLIGAVLDPASRPAGPAGTGSANLIVHELVHAAQIKAADDKLAGGAGDDLLLGDQHTVVAAFLGAFASPIAASVNLKGERLVSGLDAAAGKDTLRGGDGSDTLVGDSDTLVALITGGAVAPTGTFAMKTLIENLSVAANTDSLNGDAGTDLLEQGNRALVPKTLVKTSSIASLSKTGVPAQPPVIDWKGGFCGAGCGPLASAGAGWHVGFVTALGRSAQEQNPNAGLVLRL